MANLLSNSTICATAREAELPAPIATPISASLRASTSLTPSPVIATVCPCDCSALTIARFWSGRTRPKVVASASVAASLSVSVGSVRASTAAPVSPSVWATALTDTALSPEITLIETCWEAK
ncbi:Uncharacterised protein [Mycobacteroides abscessus subsp. abscessus]|nr:Uncharacterised protein [Mycobacteroides abscessus subsp. abscessus]SIN37887.1 Uncharacterised protein [Mycobacteroides abscessus subsp. abscessus]SKT44498.1 Uncharacterised protein [Mycobacteroides abscessus subsp. abscessus]